MAKTIQQSFLKLKQNLEITGLQKAAVSKQKNVRDIEVGGSNPLAPTNLFEINISLFY